MRRAWFWGAVVGLVAFIYAAKLPLNCEDFWYCLPSGEAVVERGRIEDPILQCYTAEAGPHVTHRWLAHAMLYGLYRTGGPKLCVVANAAVFSLAYAALVSLGLRSGGTVRTAAGATVVAFFCGMENFSVRTQTLGVAAFVGTLWLLSAVPREGPTRTARTMALAAGLGAVSAFWANTHGSFPLGAALVGSLWVEALYEGFALGREGGRRRARVLGVMLAAVCLGWLLNPYGAGIFSRFRGVQAGSVEVGVTEWRATSIASVSGKALMLSLLLLLVVFKGSRRPLRAGEALWLGGFLLMALKHERMVLWWGLAAAPILARHGADAMRTAWPGAEGREAGRLRWPGWLTLGLVAVVALFSTPYLKGHWAKGRAGFVLAPETPVAATRRLRALLGPRDRLWNPVHWGGYIAWQTKRTVFVNDQIALLPRAVARDYMTVSEGEPGWEDVLSRRRVTVLLADRTEQGALIRAAARSRDWRKVYEDELAAIYRRAEQPR
jgi:hypothetical protein